MTHTGNWRVFDFHGFYPFSDSLKHEHQLISKCKVHTIDDINNLNLQSISHHNLCIMQLNICSIYLGTIFYPCGSRGRSIALYVKVNGDVVRNDINFVPKCCELASMSLRIPRAN